MSLSTTTLTPKPSDPTTSLPVELIITILSLAFPAHPTLDAYEDTSDTGRSLWRSRTTSLLSIQLVSRTWAIVATEFLWKHLYIRREICAKLLLKSAEYGKFETKSVRLMGWSMNNRDDVTNETAVKLLRGLKGVAELGLYDFTSAKEPVEGKGQLRNWGKGYGNEVLVVEEIWKMKSLASLNSLTLLSIEIPSYGEYGTQPLSSTFTLKSFAIGLGVNYHLTPYTHFSEVCKELDSLTLLYVDSDHSDDFTEFFCSVGSTLKHLTWHRYSRKFSDDDFVEEGFSSLRQIESLQLSGPIDSIGGALSLLPSPPTLKRLLIEQQSDSLESTEVRGIEKWMDTFQGLEVLRGVEMLRNGRKIEEWDEMRERLYRGERKRFEEGVLKRFKKDDREECVVQ